MTVKELKELLKDVPDDYWVYIEAYSCCGPSRYWVNKASHKAPADAPIVDTVARNFKIPGNIE